MSRHTSAATERRQHRTASAAASVQIAAIDASEIDSIVGAASLSGAIAGTTAGAVSIGLSVAFNEVGNEVAAYINSADQGVTTTSGDVSVHAITRDRHLFDIALDADLNAEKLDQIATTEGNDGNDSNALNVLSRLHAKMNTQLASLGIRIWLLTTALGLRQPS